VKNVVTAKQGKNTSRVFAGPDALVFSLCFLNLIETEIAYHQRRQGAVGALCRSVDERREGVDNVPRLCDERRWMNENLRLSL
jgi:hypothetical protein